uniref:Protein kinase domain-containing protein n=1 Tax=Soboliphyme baturini TaxID=241478 RepID=A0A183J977_9BILA
MKNLGQHERLVNILGCITVDEPLCLIVEFCPDGDLLHYLRDRRKYMIEVQSRVSSIKPQLNVRCTAQILEEHGLNLQDVDNPDFDLEMILCLKDLMSFSWQVSVGMEYLSQKGFIHRDVAARNIMVDHKKIKASNLCNFALIGDFGLCRYVYSDPVYMGKGGRLPVKWMALEAIKSYEFTSKSDVWSFGVLLFEIITLGGSPYPGIQPSDMEKLLESGKRMEKPENCPDDLYIIMLDCWAAHPDRRPSFSELREQLRCMLEKITEDYSYLGLDPNRDYYNVVGQDEEPTTAAKSTTENEAPSESEVTKQGTFIGEEHPSGADSLTFVQG